MGYGNKMLLLACLGGLGMVLTFVFIDYRSIFDPKHYDNSSIIATFNFVEMDATGLPSFHYTLENQTDADIELDPQPRTPIVAIEQKAAPPSQGEKIVVSIDLPIFLLAKQKLDVHVVVHTPFDTSLIDTVYIGEQETRAAFAALAGKQFPNLGGFYFYDNKRRYAIEFPKGW